MRKQIIGNFLKILISALICMAAYLALYTIWGAMLAEVKNEIIRSILLATLTSAAYAFILMFLTKRRKGVGLDELMNDYKDRSYISLQDDLKLVLLHEKSRIILLGSIIGACLLLNKFDALVFGEKTISAVTFPFATMCIYSTCFSSFLDFIGYIISFAVITSLYTVFVLLYRRKQYKYWNETGHTK